MGVSLDTVLCGCWLSCRLSALDTICLGVWEQVLAITNDWGLVVVEHLIRVSEWVGSGSNLIMYRNGCRRDRVD